MRIVFVCDHKKGSVNKWSNNLKCDNILMYNMFGWFFVNVFWGAHICLNVFQNLNL